MKKNIKQQIPTIITVIFLFLIAVNIFIIGNNSLYAPDEYNYTYIYNSNQKISSFADLATSMSTLYKTWTGRIIVHGVIQLFLWLNVNVFYVLNAIVFVLFLVGITKLFNCKLSTFHLSIALFLIIYCTKMFNEKYIWLSGSLNYLWPTCLMLYTLSFFYNGIVNNKHNNILSTIAFWILAFFTGFSQENTAFVTGSFIIVLVLANIKNLLKLPIKEKLYWITSIIIFGIGAMLLLFAPGNFIRFNNASGDGHTFYIKNVFKQLYNIENLIVIYAILCISVFIKESSKDDTDNKKKHIVSSEQIKYVILPCTIGISPMLFIAEFYERAMLPYEALLIAGIIYNLNTLFKNVRLRNKIMISATGIFCFCSLFTLTNNSIFSLKYLKPYKEYYLSEAQKQKSEGLSTLVVPKFENANKVPVGNMICDFALDSLSNDFINQFAAKYFQVGAIYCVPTNYCQIEFTLDISNATPYTVTNSDKVTVATRYLNSKHPVSDVSNLILFELPKSQLENAIFQLPENIQEHIVSVKYREIGIEKAIDINTLNLGGTKVEK